MGEEALFELGRLFVEEERWADAQEAWKAYLERYPESPRAPVVHFRLGRLLASLGEHEQAVAHLRAYDAARDVADDRVALELARSYQALGDLEEAVAQYERVYTHPASGRVTRALVARALGDLWAEAQKWDQAVLWYERALEASRVPWFRAELIESIAAAEEERQNVQRAIELWHTLVADYPQTASAYRALFALEQAGAPASRLQAGIVYYYNRDWNAAVAALYDALEHEADVDQAHWYAALAYRDAGNLEAAWQELNVLVDTHPESTLRDDARLEQARLRRRQGRVEVALATYRRVVKEFPASPAAPDALWEAGTLRAGAVPDEAISLYVELADRYPQSTRAPHALWRAGQLAYRLGQYERAVLLWQRLAKRSGWEARAAFWVGKALLAGGDRSAAEAQWRELSAGTGYYALRARALRAGEQWHVRPYVPLAALDVADDLQWRRDVLGIEGDTVWADLLPPQELERGRELELMGLGREARSLYRAMISELEDEPLRLYAAARYFAPSHPALSILAAERLLAALNLTVEEVPPAVARLVYPLPYWDLLAPQAEARNIDPLLLAAVIHQESRWEPVAESPAAARGLMQVIPDTGQWIAAQIGRPFATRDLFRPIISVEFGTYYLAWLLERFEANPFYALAGYNAGPNRVPEWADADVDMFVERIALSETRTYVQAVYRHWSMYRFLYRP
ncbi:MAG: tetratricopeptide repeat protein [Ardenticatenia bacterium]|nr:tetratricopeptide repeat protein [Ardenticatenia bacterium]